MSCTNTQVISIGHFWRMIAARIHSGGCIDATRGAGPICCNGIGMFWGRPKCDPSLIDTELIWNFETTALTKCIWDVEMLFDWSAENVTADDCLLAISKFWDVSVWLSYYDILENHFYIFLYFRKPHLENNFHQF